MNSNVIKPAKGGVSTIFLATLIFFLFAGFLGKQKGKETKELCWPSPPGTPRIKYLNCISSPKDLKLKQSSLFKRMIKKFIGIEDFEFSTLVFPYGVATDSRDRIIAADAKSRLIHVFDPRGEKYFTIKPPGDDIFVSPIGVALDSEDNIYVSDSYTGKIFIFDKSGKFKGKIGKVEGLFKRPTGIAINKNLGWLYVVDTLENEIVVLDLEGREKFRFGKRGYGKGEFNFPTQICIKDNKVYITDTLNARIQIFDKDGNFVSMFGRLGSGIGDLDKPKGVAVDSEGHIYVVEGLHDVVQIFDQKGNLLLAFGGTGSGRGEFYLPTAIHIDEDDNIYVSDSYNRRIQVFRYLKSADSAGGYARDGIGFN